MFDVFFQGEVGSESHILSRTRVALAQQLLPGVEGLYEDAPGRRETVHHREVQLPGDQVLLITMLVAITQVHWDQGWAAIADSGAEDVAVRLGAAKEILREHGNYSWLTGKGNFVIFFVVFYKNILSHFSAYCLDKFVIDFIQICLSIIARI